MKTTRPKPRTVRTIEKLLFRRPTGLADGLALKELARQVAQDLTRLTQLRPPLPEHDFGHSALLARHCIPPCRVMSNPCSSVSPADLRNFCRPGELPLIADT